MEGRRQGYVRLVEVRPEVVVRCLLEFKHHGGHVGQLRPARPAGFGRSTDDLEQGGREGGREGAGCEFRARLIYVGG